MKRFLIMLVSALFLSGVAVHAQSTPVIQFGNSCAVINASTYSACCTGSAGQQNLYRCTAYNSQTSIPGTTGSGSVGTNPTNTITFPTGNFNNTQTTSSTSGSSSLSLAQCSTAKFTSLLDILIWVKCIIVAAIIPLIFAAALVFFLWGVFRFIATSDSTKKEEGKKFIIAGLIGLFVMTSLWGIIKILGTTLGVQSTVPLLQTDYLKQQ
ncbi:MAG TPA: pilin [Candidatus Paceibacterota bacterium]|nr:pilin [Candidatus Paceibacterota bacterium]